jgi:alkyldihydroxyacetonephosphate synthase
MTVGRRLKHWGWGHEDQQLDRAGLEQIARTVGERLGFEVAEIEEPVALADVKLPKSRFKPPVGLKEMFSAGNYTRALHTLGKAYRDVIRGMRGEFANPPDLVAFPETAEDVDAVLSWCADEGFAVIPFGGGTSVVGGIEPRMREDFPGVVTIDLTKMNRVLELDSVSRAARIQAGARGPQLEEELRKHGMTMRHFPQSFEYSTLGGWIATRAGGHFATLYTHIDDLVESVEAVSFAGDWRSRRLPGSGAGPSPDRMLLGSEGILGVITEAWVRVQPRPEHKTSAGVAFEDFFGGVDAVRALAQSGLNPANCRLLDPLESETTGAGPPGKALLVLGFESTVMPVGGLMEQAIEIARGQGGTPVESSGSGSDPVGAWRDAFLGAPYLRDSLAACGVLSETFETAITWDRFEDLHDSVLEAARTTIAELSPKGAKGAPRVSCRFTHVYPDGPAPYFTVLTPAVRGGEIEQWDEIKAAVSEAILDGGGTITHHHAIGRDHRPWYDRQRPEPFAAALRAAKSKLDPKGILNPGVLIDPERSPAR